MENQVKSVYSEHCPHCDSENITMIGDPEYNDEWECDDCKNTFGSFKTIKSRLLSSFIKELEWIDNPRKKASDIYKVMSKAKVPMPRTVGSSCIEITEQIYPNNHYKATLWCFNRGTGIAKGNSIIECKKNAFKWWYDFVCGFLNCP